MSARNPDGTMPARPPDDTMPDPEPHGVGQSTGGTERHAIGADAAGFPASGTKRHRGAGDAHVSDELTRLRAEVERQREKKAAYRKKASLHLMVLQHVQRELEIYKDEIRVRIESVENPFDEEQCTLAILRYRSLCEKAKAAIVVPQVKCARCKTTIKGSHAILMEIPQHLSTFDGTSTRLRVFCKTADFSAYVADKRRQIEWMHGPAENA